MANEENKSHNAPVKKYRSGAVTLDVWENTAQNNGQETTFKTYSLQRGYKDKEGNWKNTGTMRLSDLPRVEMLIREAYREEALSDKNDD